jgi:hypothetical protein
VSEPFRVPDEALEACAREPIHVPRSIQPFGSGMAFSPSLELEHGSEDLVRQLGLDARSTERALELLSSGARSWIGGLVRARRVGVAADLGELAVELEGTYVARRGLAHWNGSSLVVQLVETGRAATRRRGGHDGGARAARAARTLGRRSGRVRGSRRAPAASIDQLR